MRWGALIWGVYYGSNRRQELALIEKERRDEEERTREDRENFIKAEKAKIEKSKWIGTNLLFHVTGIGNKMKTVHFIKFLGDLLEIENAVYGAASGESTVMDEESKEETKTVQVLSSYEEYEESIPQPSIEPEDQSETFHQETIDKEASKLKNNNFPSVADGNIMYFPDETEFDHKTTNENENVENPDDEN